MKAARYAEDAALLHRMRTSIDPVDADPLAQAKKLAMFHLGMAAREYLRIAEQLAEQERTAEAERATARPSGE